MSDLISRKETARLLRAYADEVGCNRGEIELANGILKAVCFLEDSENISTAYDLEGVIKRLEEKTELAHQRYMDCPSLFPCFARYLTQYSEREMCLEIAKSGIISTEGDG